MKKYPWAKKWLYLPMISLAASLLLCNAPARGDVPEPRDYDVLFALEAPETGRLYKVRLTEEIFQKVRLSYEDDIAVFNASGDIAPFFLRKLSKAEEQGTSVLTSAQIPFFSLPQNSDDSSTVLDVSIKTGRGGRVVEVREREGQAGARSSERKRYLLDLSEALNKVSGPGKISSCTLSLSLTGTADMMASVNIYGSQNLKNWELLNEHEPLVRLNQGEQRLESRRIFMERPRTYLLLQMEDEEDATLAGVSMEFFENPVLIHKEDSVSLEGSFGKNSRMATYETMGVFPVERINAVLASPGIYPASLNMRRSKEHNWAKLGDMRLFLMKTSAEDRRNLSISLSSPLERKYWAISFDVNAPSEPPRLELFWQPREVVFLAQGSPPYVLAVGRKEKGASVQNSNLLYETMSEIPEKDILEGKAGELIARNIDAAPPQEAGTESKAWQQYLIWGVLVAGALLLSWMAFTLLRKNSGKN